MRTLGLEIGEMLMRRECETKEGRSSWKRNKREEKEKIGLGP
jgi:hypothetical protein